AISRSFLPCLCNTSIVTVSSNVSIPAPRLEPVGYAGGGSNINRRGGSFFNQRRHAPLIALSADEKRSIRKMGEKSEAFCRQALHMAEQNPHSIPATVPLADAIGDLKALDQLRPRLMRILRLAQRASDTETALGSDVMTVALKAYGQLKLTGRSEGLEDIRRE